MIDNVGTYSIESLHTCTIKALRQGKYIPLNAEAAPKGVP